MPCPLPVELMAWAKRGGGVFVLVACRADGVGGALPVAGWARGVIGARAGSRWRDGGPSPSVRCGGARWNGLPGGVIAS